jgi:hypothetical protein
MKKIFYVDLPNPDWDGDNNVQTWVNIKIVKSRKKAESILRERYRIDKQYFNLFITEGEV